MGGKAESGMSGAKIPMHKIIGEKNIQRSKAYIIFPAILCIDKKRATCATTRGRK